MDPLSSSTRADVKVLENAKTGKVTVVVAVMHLYGNAKPGGTIGYPAQPGIICLSVCHSVCL
jgi:hypothetical protein